MIISSSMGNVNEVRVESPRIGIRCVFCLMALSTHWRPLRRQKAASVSLRLGHGAALTCHRHVIHYRAAASLPKRGAKGEVLPRSAALLGEVPSARTGEKSLQMRDRSRGEKKECTEQTKNGTEGGASFSERDSAEQERNTAERVAIVGNICAAQDRLRSCRKKIIRWSCRRRRQSLRR